MKNTNCDELIRKRSYASIINDKCDSLVKMKRMTHDEKEYHQQSQLQSQPQENNEDLLIEKLVNLSFSQDFVPSKNNGVDRKSRQPKLVNLSLSFSQDSVLSKNNKVNRKAKQKTEKNI